MKNDNERESFTTPGETTANKFKSLWASNPKVNNVVYKFQIQTQDEFDKIKAFFNHYFDTTSVFDFKNLEPWNARYDYAGPSFTPCEYSPGLTEMVVSTTAVGHFDTTTSSEYLPSYKVYLLIRHLTASAKEAGIWLPNPIVSKIAPVNENLHRLSI